MSSTARLRSHLLGQAQDGVAQRVQGARGLAVGGMTPDTHGRPLEHRGLSCSSGLIATKRDAARFEGTGGRRLSLLPGRLVCHCPLPPNFLRYRGRTLHPASVGASGL